MNTKHQPEIDTMREGHPEPFSEPRTIPTGWDLSEMLSKQTPPMPRLTLDPILFLNQDEDVSQDLSE